MPAWICKTCIGDLECDEYTIGSIGNPFMKCQVCASRVNREDVKFVSNAVYDLVYFKNFIDVAEISKTVKP